MSVLLDICGWNLKLISWMHFVLETWSVKTKFNYTNGVSVSAQLFYTCLNCVPHLFYTCLFLYLPDIILFHFYNYRSPAFQCLFVCFWVLRLVVTLVCFYFPACFNVYLLLSVSVYLIAFCFCIPACFNYLSVSKSTCLVCLSFHNTLSKIILHG